MAILKGEQYGKMELKYAKGWSLPECVTSSEDHKRPPPYWQILENMIIAPQFLKYYIGYLLDNISISRMY